MQRQSLEMFVFSNTGLDQFRAVACLEKAKAAVLGGGLSEANKYWEVANAHFDADEPLDTRISRFYLGSWKPFLPDLGPYKVFHDRLKAVKVQIDALERLAVDKFAGGCADRRRRHLLAGEMSGVAGFP